MPILSALFNLEQALKVRRLDDSCRIQVERLAEDNRDALSALKKNLIELVSLGEQSTLTKVDAILEALEITLCDKQIQKDIALNDRIERLAAQTDGMSSRHQPGKIEFTYAITSVTTHYNSCNKHGKC